MEVVLFSKEEISWGSTYPVNNGDNDVLTQVTQKRPSISGIQFSNTLVTIVVKTVSEMMGV